VTDEQSATRRRSSRIRFGSSSQQNNGTTRYPLRVLKVVGQHSPWLTPVMLIIHVVLDSLHVTVNLSPPNGP
jgi:hypothetical protein